MVALYVTSLASGSGKTTIGAGVGKYLLSSGKRVGFFKPTIAGSNGKDGDIAFMKHLFGLDEPQEALGPVFDDENSLRSSLKEAYARVSFSKDVIIVEDVLGESRASVDLAGTLDARVIVVGDYSEELSRVVDFARGFGGRLLGVVVNKVPKRRLERVRSEVSLRFESARASVLGVLPEDRSLLALTIGELTGLVQGKILLGAEKSAELVENVMLGANLFDNTFGAGPLYFGRKANKAVVLKSERPDMQMASLETPTACLVLTGNTAIKEAVIARAKEKDVPIITVQSDTNTVVTQIEEALGKSRFCQDSKLPKLTEIMQQHFNLAAVYRGLGFSA